MSDGISIDRAPGLIVADGVELPDDLELGANVVIHAGVELARGCAIEDQVVIGKAPRLGPRSTASRERPGATRIGERVVVCVGAIVYARAEIGARSVIGDQAQVRERARVGEETVIGRGSGVDNDVRVGDRVRLQSSCYVAAGAVIEDDAFLGPGAILTNDATAGRRAGAPLEPPILGRACRIGGGAVICPGVRVGEEAFVGAGAAVTEDVPPRTVVVGVPARRIREVSEDDLIDRV